MSADHVIKSLPALRLVAVTATIDPACVPGRVGPMFDAVSDALVHAPGTLDTPVATYALTDQGVDVVVGFATTSSEAPVGTQLVALASTDAVCGVHLGSMATIQQSWEALRRWMSEHGYECAGPCREVYVRAVSDDQADWVTELQQPIVPPPDANRAAPKGAANGDVDQGPVPS